MKVLVIDNGLYTELALTLGRSGLFESVGYFCEWKEDFPFTKDAVIGAGFPEVVREMDLYDALTAYDAFVFPDNYWAGLQGLLRNDGKPVWGSGSAEELELDRRLLRRKMKDYNLPTPQYHVARGLPYLLEDEKLEEGDFVKVSRYRGLMETTKFEGWDSPDWLYDVAKELGPVAHDFEFIVEKPLKGVEIGFDGIVVRGSMLYPCLLGIEKKDAGYLGRVVDTLPPFQQRVLSGLEAMLDVDYSNFLSVELRGPVLLDICTRLPQPPSHGMLSCFDVASITYEHLASGQVDSDIHDTKSGEWISMIVLKRTNNDRYMKVKLSGEAKKHARFSRQFMYDGELWIAPGKAHEIGTVSGLGSTPQEAQEHCLEVLKGVEADDLTTTGARDGFEELLSSWEEATREGVA